jgi:hypothetical protein
VREEEAGGRIALLADLKIEKHEKFKNKKSSKYLRYSLSRYSSHRYSGKRIYPCT